jgi:two-component system chemotaxis response regulator CheY
MEYTNTILVVDDSEMVVKVLSFIIKKAGYTVLSAIDGKAALEFFDGREIDLVITDLNMPNMNGIELISEIRLKEYYRHIPIILFSAGNDEEQKQMLKTSGATLLFDKNDIQEKMIPTIKKMLG